MATIPGLLLPSRQAARRASVLTLLLGSPWQIRRSRTPPPADQSEPAGAAQAPRCEAWTLARQGRPAHRCPNVGAYWRNGRRVCMAHKNARWVAFDKETAEHLSRPR